MSLLFQIIVYYDIFNNMLRKKKVISIVIVATQPSK